MDEQRPAPSQQPAPPEEPPRGPAPPEEPPHAPDPPQESPQEATSPRRDTALVEQDDHHDEEYVHDLTFERSPSPPTYRRPSMAGAGAGAGAGTDRFIRSRHPARLHEPDMPSATPSFLPSHLTRPPSPPEPTTTPTPDFHLRERDIPSMRDLTPRNCEIFLQELRRYYQYCETTNTIVIPVARMLSNDSLRLIASITGNESTNDRVLLRHIHEIVINNRSSIKIDIEQLYADSDKCVLDSRHSHRPYLERHLAYVRSVQRLLEHHHVEIYIRESQATNKALTKRLLSNIRNRSLRSVVTRELNDSAYTLDNLHAQLLRHGPNECTFRGVTSFDPRRSSTDRSHRHSSPRWTRTARGGRHPRGGRPSRTDPYRDPPSRTRTPTCHRCGELGHISPDCHRNVTTRPRQALSRDSTRPVYGDRPYTPFRRPPPSRWEDNRPPARHDYGTAPRGRGRGGFRTRGRGRGYPRGRGGMSRRAPERRDNRPRARAHLALAHDSRAATASSTPATTIDATPTSTHAPRSSSVTPTTASTTPPHRLSSHLHDYERLEDHASYGETSHPYDHEYDEYSYHDEADEPYHDHHDSRDYYDYDYEYGPSAERLYEANSSATVAPHGYITFSASDRPLRVPFVFDTGASLSIIPLHIARQLQDSPHVIVQESSPVSIYPVASGTTPPLTTVGTLRANIHITLGAAPNAQVYDCVFHILDKEGDHVLIGEDFMKQRCNITVHEHFLPLVASAMSKYNTDGTLTKVQDADHPLLAPAKAVVIAYKKANNPPPDRLVDKARATNKLDVDIDDLHHEHFNDSYDVLDRHDCEDSVRQLVRRVLDSEAPAKCRRQIADMIFDYADVFATGIPDIPSDVPPVRTTLKPDASPVRQPPRTLKPNAEKFMRLAIDKLLKANAIFENPHAAWSAPAFAVPRPGVNSSTPANKTHRLVQDYRMTNAQVDPLRINPPVIREVLSVVQGANVFGTSDMQDAFHCLPLHLDSQEIWSFSALGTVFTPTRVMQGSIDGTAAQTLAVQYIFGDLHGLVIYLDDILLFADSHEHFVHLVHEVLLRCRRHGVRLNPRKSDFLLPSTRWCGMIVDGQGYRYDPVRFKPLLDMGMPTNGAELLRWISAMNYFSTSIPAFATITAGARDCLEKCYERAPMRRKSALASVKLDDTVGFDDRTKDSINAVNRSLADNIKMAHPRGDDFEFNVFTDASEIAMAGLVTQTPIAQRDMPIADRHHEIVFITSHRFSKPELSRAIIDKEAGAVAVTLKKASHCLISVHPIHVYVDCANVVFLYNNAAGLKRTTSDRLQRTAVILSAFNLEWHHISGNDNFFADILTRHALPAPQRATANMIRASVQHIYDSDDEYIDLSDADFHILGKAPPAHIIAMVRTRQARRDEHLQDEGEEETKEHADTTTAAHTTTTERTPTVATAPTAAPITTPDESDTDEEQHEERAPHHLSQRDAPLTFSLEEIRARQTEELDSNEQLTRALGLKFDEERRLYVLGSSRRVYIPEDDVLRLRLCIIAHQSTNGHRGQRATAQLLAHYVYWSTLKPDVYTFVSSCIHCIPNRYGKRIRRPLASQMHATTANQIIHMDYLFMQDSASGHKYILTVMDDLSGYTALYPTTNADAATTVNSLLDWISRYGLPELLISDQGSHFKAQLVEALTARLRIKHHMTVAYAPQSNGTVERLNKTVLQAFRALLSEYRMDPDTWPDLIPIVVNFINTTPKERLNNLSPLQAFMGHETRLPLDALFITKTRTLSDRRLQPAEIADAATQLLERLDELHRGPPLNRGPNRQRSGEKPIDFTVGDYVLVAQPIDRSKLRHKWKGPYRVVAMVPDTRYVYTVQHLLNDERSNVHADRLALYSDQHLEVTAELRLQIAHDDGGYPLKRLVKITQDLAHTYVVTVEWEGPEDNTVTTTEPLKRIYEDVPLLVRQLLATERSDMKKAKILSFLGL